MFKVGGSPRRTSAAKGGQTAELTLTAAGLKYVRSGRQSSAYAGGKSGQAAEPALTAADLKNISKSAVLPVAWLEWLLAGSLFLLLIFGSRGKDFADEISRHVHLVPVVGSYLLELTFRCLQCDGLHAIDLDSFPGL